MLNNICVNPLLWIGLYIVGYIIAIVVLCSSDIQNIVENKMPKPIVRIFIFLTFIAFPVILPFSKGPKMAIPTFVAFTIGIFLLGVNLYIKILAQSQIGVSPALKGKEQLITTGMYKIVRHPLYLSNGLLAIGMAILLRSIYALLFSIAYTFLYLPIMLLRSQTGAWEREEAGLFHCFSANEDLSYIFLENRQLCQKEFYCK